MVALAWRLPGSRKLGNGVVPGAIAIGDAIGAAECAFEYGIPSAMTGGMIAANVIAGVEANSARGVPSVVLQHDIKAFSVDAVEEILIWGLENGYHFEAMSAGGYVTQHRIAN